MTNLKFGVNEVLVGLSTCGVLCMPRMYIAITYDLTAWLLLIEKIR